MPQGFSFNKLTKCNSFSSSSATVVLVITRCVMTRDCKNYRRCQKTATMVVINHKEASKQLLQNVKPMNGKLIYIVQVGGQK